MQRRFGSHLKKSSDPRQEVRRLRVELREAKDMIEKQARRIKRLSSEVRSLKRDGDPGGWERESLRSRIPETHEMGQ